MSDKNPPARHKVVWGYGIIHKYLNWYIRTSEVIPKEQQVEMIESLEVLFRQIQKADRTERRNKEAPEPSEWANYLNQKRRARGQRPVGERRMVDELIKSILE